MVCVCGGRRVGGPAQGYPAPGILAELSDSDSIPLASLCMLTFQAGLLVRSPFSHPRGLSRPRNHVPHSLLEDQGHTEAPVKLLRPRAGYSGSLILVNCWHGG